MRYIGNKLLLFTPLEGVDLNEVLKGVEEWMNKLFESVVD